MKVEEKSGHRPGQTLLWGIYQIAYVAYDGAGNAATCTFKVSLLCKYMYGTFSDVIEHLLPFSKWDQN